MAVSTLESRGGRLGIKARLAILLGAAAFGMIALIIVFGALLRSSTRTLTRINAQTRSQAESVLRTVERAARLQDLTLKLVREKDLDNIEALFKESDAATQDLRSQIGAMGDAATTAAFTSLTNANDRVRDAVMHGEGATAHTVFIEESTPAFQTLLTRIREQQQQYLSDREKEAKQEQTTLAATQTIVIIVAALLVVVIGALGLVLTRNIARAIGTIVEKVKVVADGDLRVSLTSTEEMGAADEIGDLYRAFAEMLGSLRDLQERVSAAFRELEQAVADVNVLASGLQSGSEKQSRSVDEITTLVTRSNDKAGGTVVSMQAQAEKSEETSSSIVEMISSIDQVSKNTDSLSGSVEETSSAIVQVLNSNSEVSRNVEALNELISRASVSIAQIDRSVKEVESLAQESRQISAHVKDSAMREGSAVIQEAIGEMDRIRGSVLSLSDTVEKLSTSVGSIGEILAVIEHVAHQTNLLALNAAIIAAQAGEHGRAFAVVAEEIHDLAERTTSSTQEIAQVITGIRTETGNVGVLVREGVSRVDAGVRAVSRTDAALKSIIASSEQAAEMSQRIAVVTAEQASGSLEVSRSIREIVDLSSQISRATVEQAQGSTSIIRAVENMRDLAQHVRSAMGEQASTARLISKAASDSSRLAQEVTSSAQESKQFLERAAKETSNISASARETLGVVSRMKKLVETFDALAGHLKSTLSQFRT